MFTARTDIVATRQMFKSLIRRDGPTRKLSLARDVSAIVRNIGYEQELLIIDYDVRF
jgi:hypothetical protein